VEAVANVLVGIVISFISQVIIFKYYGIAVPTAVNVQMTLYFTLISLVRSYALRRFFNGWRSKLLTNG